MGDRQVLLIGAVLAGLGVALGAFGAHVLSGRLAPTLVAAFETGARYQMYHALALVALSARIPGSWSTRIAAGLFVLGVILFSGSLYLVTLLGLSWAGAVTPVGGVALIGGWAMLAWAAWSSRAVSAGQRAAADRVAAR